MRLVDAVCRRVDEPEVVIGWPARWELAFDSFLVPFIGFLIAPWTTLAYVVVAPSGVRGFDYVLLGLAVLVDILALGGSGSSGRDYQARRRMEPAY
ncbi:MAG TPA: hypothetical protein VMW08_12885 [Acidimicrobiales bacterium]|nr:hypothetical protein [Acidimicrobiales bacterium]